MEAHASKIWTVKVSSQAQSYLRRLTPSTRKLIIEELLMISGLENPPDHSNIRPLLGPLKGSYRLRIGIHRIIFDLLRDEKIIAVGAIKPRGDAYK